MAKGDGGLQELRRGVWRVSVSAGNNPATGKRQRVTRVVHGTKAEARKVRDDIRRGLDNGLRPDGGKVRFLEFVATFSQARRNAGRASEDRIAKDEKSLKLCGELLGDPPLCKVDARAIEALYPAIRERREAQGFRCGSTTLHGYHVLLKSFFQKAVDYDLIGRNPCNRVEAPKADKPQRRALSLDEVRRLLAAVDAEERKALDALAAKERRQAAWGVAEDRGYLLGMREVCHVLAVRLGIATGMRLGEVLGLTWGAVDFGHGLVSVVRTLKADGTLKEPKTEAGRRVVAVDAVTMAHLKAWKALQAEALDTLCIDVGGGFPGAVLGDGRLPRHRELRAVVEVVPHRRGLSRSAIPRIEAHPGYPASRPGRGREDGSGEARPLRRFADAELVRPRGAGERPRRRRQARRAVPRGTQAVPHRGA